MYKNSGPPLKIFQRLFMFANGCVSEMIKTGNHMINYGAKQQSTEAATATTARLFLLGSFAGPACIVKLYLYGNQINSYSNLIP